MNKPRQCLIIDDDEDDQEIFIMCVKKISKNIECQTANDGVEAILMLRSERDYIPDYIFLDVNMPKMNGLDCLKEVKRIRKLSNTKILMYSTTSESKVLNETKKLGADEFIVKPAKISDLKERLYNIFQVVSGIDDSNN